MLLQSAHPPVDNCVLGTNVVVPMKVMESSNARDIKSDDQLMSGDFNITFSSNGGNAEMPGAIDFENESGNLPLNSQGNV